MRLVRWSCLWSILAIVSACSDDTSNPTPPPTPMPDGASPMPDAANPEPEAGADGNDDGGGAVDMTCDDYAQLECMRDRDCFAVYLDWTYGSFETCLTQAKQTCQVWTALNGTSLTSTRLVKCLRANIAAGCNARSEERRVGKECRSRG